MVLSPLFKASSMQELTVPLYIRVVNWVMCCLPGGTPHPPLHFTHNTHRGRKRVLFKPREVLTRCQLPRVVLKMTYNNARYEFEVLESIVMVIDMEGFFLPHFICRELGSTNIYGGFTNNMYSPLMKYTDLDAKQIRQVRYVRRRIHGLQFTPSMYENAKPHQFLKIDLTALYNTYKTNKRDVVAYKEGGGAH